MTQDDIFSAQVHAVVVQLGEWLQAENPDIDRLMPALAVVLGRVIAHRAANETEIDDMLVLASNATRAAAFEAWVENRPPPASH
jgi:hypothetical protein